MPFRVYGDASNAMRSGYDNLRGNELLLDDLTSRNMDTQKRAIEKSTQISGATMAPLKRPRKAGHPYGNQPLLDTTEMYQSIHFVRLRTQTLPTLAEAGPSARHALFQNNGTRDGEPGGIPPRVFIGITSDERTSDERDVYRFGFEALTRAARNTFGARSPFRSR